MAQSAEEKEKEIKELTLKFEIEKQKNRKLQQEIDILKQKLEKSRIQPKPEHITSQVPPPAVGAPPKPGHAPVASPATPAGGGQTAVDLTQFIDRGLKDSVAGVEIEELRTRLESLTQQYRQAEQEKWDVARKNIELKEEHQRLKVKGVNLRKDIESLNEKLDRKENQNFKSRLEITDLKKENARADERAGEATKHREMLEKQISDIETRLENERGKLKEERRSRDMVHAEYQRYKDMLAEYETHWAARFYNR
jgi:DNA repair exonuclease SbcCD ATPase subunit